MSRRVQRCIRLLGQSIICKYYICIVYTRHRFSKLCEIKENTFKIAVCVMWITVIVFAALKLEQVSEVIVKTCPDVTEEFQQFHVYMFNPHSHMFAEFKSYWIQVKYSRNKLLQINPRRGISVLSCTNKHSTNSSDNMRK